MGQITQIYYCTALFALPDMLTLLRQKSSAMACFHPTFVLLSLM